MKYRMCVDAYVSIYVDVNVDNPDDAFTSARKEVEGTLGLFEDFEIRHIDDIYVVNKGG